MKYKVPTIINQLFNDLIQLGGIGVKFFQKNVIVDISIFHSGFFVHFVREIL